MPGSLEELEVRMQSMRTQARIGLLRRCAVLERYVHAIDQGTTDQADHHDAIAQAHQLIGTAGTFGFARGSELSREIEDLLLAADDSSVTDPGRLTDLVRQLRPALEPSSVSEAGAGSAGPDAL